MKKRTFYALVLALTLAAAGALAAEADVQEFTVEVGTSYSPAEITVIEGSPVRIHFIRESAANCGGKVVFPDLEIERDLPAGKTTTIEFVPEKAGTLSFTCGMGMMKGAVVVTKP